MIWCSGFPVIIWWSVIISFSFLWRSVSSCFSSLSSVLLWTAQRSACPIQDGHFYLLPFRYRIMAPLFLHDWQGSFSRWLFSFLFFFRSRLITSLSFFVYLRAPIFWRLFPGCSLNDVLSLSTLFFLFVSRSHLFSFFFLFPCFLFPPFLVSVLVGCCGARCRFLLSYL